jgi:eukaryotic-like serine/threonine-protein kinase
MSTDLARLEQIFAEAAEQADAAARAAFLEKACGDDAGLRHRVAALLAAHDSADSFLKPPMDGPTFSSLPLGVGPQSRIGRYKVLEQIGEGGFGVVFMAEQEEPVRRMVALKIIKLGMDTRQVVARFEAERQALAAMDHPNIARVLDAGATDDGRPYFVMELVNGVPITEFCDRQLLSVRRRLELMTTVCNAVQHAHHKGIIHRDLKPSNILVADYDGQPVPKVIDFGVAKATGEAHVEATMFTRQGQIIGTLEYMSPEQAQFSGIDVDTRSDVYSLGILLYELLTGSTPFEKQRIRSAPFDEMLRMVREEEPPLPSTRLDQIARPSWPGSASAAAKNPPRMTGLDDSATVAANRQSAPIKLAKLIHGELDWIVMKALEKDRNRRYATANALALDVQRYLNDEAVEARPLNRAYRLKKFIRRHKAGMLAGSAIAALLLTVIVILLVSNARIRNEARIRDLALHAKDVALKDKDMALATAQEAVDRMLTQVASERFSDMPLSHPMRIALLEDALAFYERLAGQMGADRALRHQVATLLHTHAGLLREVGDYDRAARALRESSDLLEKLADTDPHPPAILEERVIVEFDLAFTLHRGDESKLLTDRDAQVQYRRALALFDELEQRWPGHCEPPLLSHRMLAKVAFDDGDRAEALRLWRAGLALGTAYLDQHPGHLSVCIEMGWTCVHLCDALSSETMESMSEIDGVLTLGMEVVDQSLVDQPKSTRAADVTAALQIRMAMLRCRQGRVDDALPIFEQAVAGMQALCEGSPWTVDYWNSLRWFYQEIAARLSAAGRNKEAQRAMGQFQQWLDRVSPKLADDPKLQEQVRVSQELLDDLLRSTKQVRSVDVKADEPAPERP